MQIAGGTLELANPQLGPTDGPRRLVIVADNSVVVEAIRLGFRKSGEFSLVGHADGRRTSAARVLSVQPDVVLLDDMGRSERALALLQEIREAGLTTTVILLGLHLDATWLDRAFAAGATAVISKATRPVALATLVGEITQGHIFHRGPTSPERPTSLNAFADGAADLPLTPRELEILRLVASGSTNSDVARLLWITDQTVKFHLRNIYRKLGVANRTQASHLAHIHGLATLPTGGDASLEAELSIAS